MQHIYAIDFVSQFSGCTLGKVFCLYLLVLLFGITVSIYVWLSGMNIKTLDIWREISLGIFCLVHSATLYHFCNCAHYLANNVRYQRNLFKHIYMVFFVYVTV